MRFNIKYKITVLVLILALSQLLLIGILASESKNSLEAEANNRLEIQKQQVEIQAKNFRDLVDSMHRFTGNNIETNLEVARGQFKKECGNYVEKVDDHLVCENGMIIEDRITEDNTIVRSIKNIVHGHASIFVNLGSQTAKKISTTVTEGQYKYGYIESVSTYNEVIIDGKDINKYTKQNGIYKTKACEALKNSNNEIVGMMCVGIPEAPTIAQITEKVKDNSFGKAGRIVLIDTYAERLGQIIYHPTVSRGTNVSEKPHIKTMLNNTKGGFNFHYEGNNPTEHVAYFLYYEPYDMMIVAENELLDEQSVNSKQIILLSIAVLIISLIVGLLFSRKITEPIIKLKESADKVTSGHFDYNLPNIKSNDEVSDLTASLAMLIAAFKFLKQKNQPDKVKPVQQETPKQPVTAQTPVKVPTATQAPQASSQVQNPATQGVNQENKQL